MQTEVVAKVRHLVKNVVVDSVNAFVYWTAPPYCGMCNDEW